MENLRPGGTEGGKGGTPLQGRGRHDRACIALSGLNPEPEASSGRTPIYLIKYRIALQLPCDLAEQLIRFRIPANSLYIQSMEFLTKIIDSELLRSILTLLASIFSSPLFKKI